MLEVLFDLHGHLPVNLIVQVFLIMEFKRFIVTKLEDVTLMILITPMEEIVDLLMEVQELVKFQLQYLLILLMELGLFNGHGLVVLLLWEIIIHVLITKSQEELLLELKQTQSFTEEITLTLDRRSANFSTQTDFTNA